MGWLTETARPAQRHSTYLVGGRVRTPCGRYYHGRTAGKRNPLYVCRHHLTTPAGDPDRCGCVSIRVDSLDQLVWSQVRAALSTPRGSEVNRPRRRRPDNERHTTSAGVDIGADTLADRITAAAEDIADLQRTIAEEYQAARADRFDAATARLMLQTRRGQLAQAQATLVLLHRVRTTLTPTPTRSHSDRAAVEHARVRLDDLDIDGKHQMLELLGVRADVTGYHPCPTCAGTGYAPIPPGSQRHWPPSCPS